jgi:hypothetical protein
MVDYWKDPKVNFPAHVKVTDSFDYNWFNQITDYVLKLEDRIQQLETGRCKDCLADSPYIASTEPDEYSTLLGT